VGHRPAVRQDEVDALRAVHRAAAPEADERVDLLLRSEGGSARDHVRVGIVAKVVEGHAFDSGVRERPSGRRHVARLDEPLVGDEERPAEAELARELAEAGERALPVDDPGPGDEVEAFHGPLIARPGVPVYAPSLACVQSPGSPSAWPSPRPPAPTTSPSRT